MYYSYINNFKGKTYRFIAISFLFATFFLNFLDRPSFADEKSSITDNQFGPTAEEYRSIGYKAQQEGDFDRALTFYNKVLGMGEGTPWLYNNLGVIYEQMGFPNRAEECYLKSLEMDSNYLPPYTNLAYFYENRGDIPRAISYFRTRIKYASKDDKWVPLLVKELSKIDPTYHNDVVKAQLEETGQRLFQVAQEQLSLDVARADGHYRQAKKLAAENHYDEALDALKKALVLTPDSPKVKKLKKKILYDQRVFEIKEKTDAAVKFLDSGDMDSARQEFQKILTILPDKSAQK